MNPYDAHAAAQAQLETVLAEPLAGQTQAGGKIRYNNLDYSATISPFTIQQILRPDGGGFSPSLMASAIVRKSLLPAAINFHTGHDVTTTSVDGKVRQCRIASADDNVTFWELQLVDKNQGA